MERKDLDNILWLHSLWLEGKKDGRKAILIEVDLRGMNLHAVDLSGAEITGADLRDADLSDAIMSGASLSNVDFGNANLCNASFNEATFSEVIFTRANLSEADLVRTNLSGISLRQARLFGADLSNAKLVSSDLSEAVLHLANFSGADLSKANLGEADFNGSDLNQACFNEARARWCNFLNIRLDLVKGLETVVHEGPSSIDFETIRNSKGLISESFLRGCGLQDWEIENTKLYEDEITKTRFSDVIDKTLQLRFSNSVIHYSVFISYSRRDKIFAQALHDALQLKGVRCWLDEIKMLPGDDIYTQIDRGIKHFDKFLLCCSRNSLSGKWWVDFEINKAFEKERKLMGHCGEKVILLIPLDLDGYLFSPEYEGAKKDEILSRGAADFNNWQDNPKLFNDSVAKIVNALQASSGR